MVGGEGVIRHYCLSPMLGSMPVLSLCGSEYRVRVGCLDREIKEMETDPQ